MNNSILNNSKARIFLTLLTVGICCHVAVASTEAKVSQNLNSKFDTYLAEVMKTHEIPGMGVAIIKDNQLIYKSYLGTNNRDKVNAPVNENTVFRLYSLSKIMTAVGVFKLIDSGKLSLENKLSNHFENLPSSWNNIAIKHLLSHTSGLPDIHHLSIPLADESISDKSFLALLYSQPLDFKPGDDWRYNQTNYLLLKLIIEKASEMKFEDFIMTTQFTHSNPSDVYFLADPAKELPDRAHYYSFNRTDNEFETKNEHLGTRNHPLSGINITLDEFIEWNNKLDANVLLPERIKASMWTAAEIKNSDRKFLYGWDVYDLNQHDTFGFSGGGVSGYRKVVDKNLSIIVLTTGYKYYSMQDIVIDHLAGLVENALIDEEKSLTETITDHYFLTDSPSDMLSKALNVKTAYPNANLEKIFKTIGYRLFFDLDQKEQAIELNKFNVILHPSSYDTYGTLGYLYFLNKQYDLAKVYYTKAKELNPQNSYSNKRLFQIEALLSNENTH